MSWVLVGWPMLLFPQNTKRRRWRPPSCSGKEGGRLPGLWPWLRWGMGSSWLKCHPPITCLRRIRKHILSTTDELDVRPPRPRGSAGNSFCTTLQLRKDSRPQPTSRQHLQRHDILCYQGCKTDHQNETHPQQHWGFHLESFGLSLSSTVSGRAGAVRCVS